MLEEPQEMGSVGQEGTFQPSGNCLWARCCVYEREEGENVFVSGPLPIRFRVLDSL